MHAVVLVATLLLACSGPSQEGGGAHGPGAPPPGPPPPGGPGPAVHQGSVQGLDRDMILTTVAWAPGGAIPSTYTCEGEDISPPLDWQSLPQGTESLALIVEDPDAPDPADPQTIWTHWLLYNLPAEERSGIPEASRHLPLGTLQGKNDFGRTGYGGPCPPIGEHRYFHKLYALDTMLPDLGEPDRAALLAAMEGHVIYQVDLVGTYSKRAAD
jgi:Raf kinase inhibitor-like YbhB/YbcL family protein